MLTGQISGTVFNDSNGNGVRDPGDTGLAGQTVFLDTNQNGVADSFTKTYTATDLPKKFYGSGNNWLGYPSSVTSTISIPEVGVPAETIQVNVAENAYNSISAHGLSLNVPGDFYRLYNGSGTGGYMSVTFDNQASRWIGDAGYDPTGSFRPYNSFSNLEGSLESFNGRSIVGNWSLTATTNSFWDGSSSLTQFSVTVHYAEPVTTTDSNGNYRFSFGDIPAHDFSIGVDTPGYLATTGVKGVERLNVPEAANVQGVNFGVRPDNANETQGNSRATAIDLGTLQGSLFVGPNAIAPGGDQDWYTFTLDRPAKYGNEIAIDFNGELGDLDLDLYDATGKLLRETDTSTSHKWLPMSSLSSDVDHPDSPHTNPLLAGTYYIKVSGASQQLLKASESTTSIADSNPAYTLTFSGPGSDAFDRTGNNTPGQATDLVSQATANNGFVQLQALSIDQSSDVDWFRLVSATPLKPGNNWFRILFDGTLGNLDLELYDATGTRLLARSNGAGDTDEIQNITGSAGTYLLKIYGFHGATNSNYTLQAFYPLTAGDRFEVPAGNDLQTTATILGIIEGTQTVDNLSLNSSTDIDWYQFTTTTVGTSANWVRLQYDSSLGPIAAKVVDSNGHQWPLTAYGDVLQASLAGLAAGTYYVQVQGQSGTTVPKYQINWNAPVHLHNDWVFAVNQFGPRDLRTVHGQETWNDLSLNADQSARVYSFDLSDKGTASDFVRIGFDDALGDINLTVYSTTGKIIGRSQSSQNIEQVSLEGADPGTYVVVVSGASEDVVVPAYTLTIHAPPVVTAERFEANDNRGTATDLGEFVGTRTLDRLTMSSDGFDYYKIKLTRQGEASDLVRIDFNESYGQLELALIDGSGQYLEKSSLTEGNREEISLAGIAAGDYYILVGSEFVATTNPLYQMTLQGPSATTFDDWSETIDGRANNNAVGSATNLGTLTGTNTWSNLALVGDKDVDWFKFTLPQSAVSGQQLALNFDLSHGDLDVELHDAGGALLRTEYAAADLKTISLDGLAAGAYTIKITGTGFTNVFPYLLQVIAPGGRRSLDSFEPNNVRALATDLGSVQGYRTWGMDAAGPLSIDIGTDQDWYKFQLSAKGIQGQYAGLSFDSTQGDLSLELYDSNGHLVDSSTTLGNGERISLAGLGGATATAFYLHVFSADGKAQPAYTLTIVAPGTDVTEGGDVLYSYVPDGCLAVNTDTGNYTASHLSIDANDEDWFAFQLPADAVEGDSVQISFSQIQGDLQLDLYTDRNGSPIRSSNGTSDGERISLAGLTRNNSQQQVITYYVKISGVNGALNPSYSFSLNTTPALKPDFLENGNVDAVQQEGLIEGLFTVHDNLGNQQLSIDRFADVDWFSFGMTSAPNASHYVQISFNQFAGDLDLELYDATGTKLLRRSATANSVETISLDGLPNLDADGHFLQYRVKVLGYNGATNPDYHLTFLTPSSIFSDWAEPNNSSAQAKDLRGIEGDATLNGLSLHQSGDTDYFKFQLTSHGINGTGLTLNSDVGYGTLDLTLYDATGKTVLADSQVYSGQQFVSFATLPAGTYLARITAANGTSTVPSYSLHFIAPQVRGDWSEDTGNRGDTRTSAYSLQTVQGDQSWYNISIHNSTDEDWFAFQLRSDAVAGHFAEISSDYQLGDIDIELYDASGNRLNASSGGNTSQNIDRVSLAGLKAVINGVRQTYYVRVSGYRGATQPNYSLRINAPQGHLAGDVFDSAAPNNTLATATPLVLNGGVQSQTGLSIHQTGDVDYYQFELPADGAPGSLVGLDFNAAQGNLVLQLLRGDGTLIQTSVGQTGHQAISLNGLPAASGSTRLKYYVRVLSAGAAGITTQPDYSLTFVTPTAPTDDRLEGKNMNNTVVTATPLRDITGQVVINGLTLPSSDEDWFQFNLTSTGQAGDFVRSATGITSGTLTLSLFAAGNTSNPIQTSANGSDLQEVSLQGLPQGTYYIHISSGNQIPVGDYSLAISAPAELKPDSAEGARGNNSTDSAFDLGDVATASGRMTQQQILEQAYYNATLKAAQNTTIPLFSNYNPLDPNTANDLPNINLVTGFGTLGAIPGDLQLASNLTTNNQGGIVAQFDEKSGDLFQLGSNLAGGQMGQIIKNADQLGVSYNAFAQSGLSYSAFNGNGNLFTAAASPQPTVQQLLITQQLQQQAAANQLAIEQYYAPRIAAAKAAQDQYNAAVNQYIQLQNQLQLQQYNQQVAQQRALEQQQANYIRLGGNPGTSYAGFTGNQLSSFLGLPFLGMASGLAPVAVLPGLSINTPSDQDWFHFALTQTGRSDDFVRIVFDPTRGKLKLSLFVKIADSSVVLVDQSNDVTGSEEISLNRLQPGSYFVKIEGVDGGTNPEYRLEFSLQQAPQNVRADWSEPSNSLSTARDLKTIEGVRTFDGLNLDRSGDEDWFAFTTTATAQADDYLDVRFSSAYGDVDVELYDPSGHLLASSTGTTGIEHLPLRRSSDNTLLPAGQYFIRVFGHEGATSPGYQLTIAATGSTLEPDAFESNNSRNLATDLGQFTSVRQLSDLTIQGAVGSTAADVDWYTFDLLSTGRSSNNLQIDFDSSRGALQIQLFDHNGNLLTRPGATSAQIPLIGLPTGTYCAKVSGVTATTSNRYTLNYDLPPASTAGNSQDAWTIFVYMTAGDLSQFAKQDINELEQAAARLPSSVNLVVLLDQSATDPFATAGGSQPAWTGAGMAVIQPDLDPDTIATRFIPAAAGASSLNIDINSAASSSLQNFLVWGARVAPAQRYALICWNHGAAIDGANIDTDSGTGNRLQISEIVSAVTSAKAALGSLNLQVISFDACQMQTVEVTQALGAVAPVIVGSEELEGASGANYASSLAVFAQNPNAVTAQQLGAALVLDYGYRNLGDVHEADTLSSVAAGSAGMSSLVSALKTFTDAVANIPDGSANAALLRTVILSARETATAFNRRPDLRDLRQFLQNVITQSTGKSAFDSIRSAASQAIQALDNVVLAKTQDQRSVGGLSVYWPGPGETIDPTYSTEFTAFLNATGWGLFVQRFNLSSSSASVSAQPDWAEADDTFSRAFNLGDVVGSGNLWTGLSLHSTDDVDWYRFRLPEGGTSTSFATIASALPGVSLSALLYRAAAPTSPLRLGTAVGGTARISLQLAAGEYLLKVFSPAKSIVGNYWMTMTVPSVKASTNLLSDPQGNHSLDKAMDLGVITSSAMFGGLAVQTGMTDWYSFSTPRSLTSSSDTDGLVMLRIPGGNTLSASLWNAAGTLIQQQRGTGQLIFRYPARAAGKFYISISSAQSTSMRWPYALQFDDGSAHAPGLQLRTGVAAITSKAPGQLTVARTDVDLTNPLTVALTVSQGNLLQLPSTITIPAGAVATTISLPAVPGLSANGIVNVTIKATAAGYALSTITVAVIQSPPVIEAFGTSVVYQENAAPTRIADNAKVTDADSLDFAGGSMTVKLLANSQATDVISILNVGSGSGQIVSNDSGVFCGGILIASFSGGTANAPLVISFNNEATPARVTALLRAIAFNSTSDSPSTLPRTVQVTVRDGDGGISIPATKAITVISVNDKQIGTAKTVTLLEDKVYTFTGSDFGFTDPMDSLPNALKAVKISTLPAIGILTNNAVEITAGSFITVAELQQGKLKFAPVTNGNGTPYASFTFQVQDNGGTANGGVDLDSTPRKMTMAVSAVNDAPTGTSKTITISKNSSYVFSVADFGFSDAIDSPSNTFLAVKLATLPTVGNLTINGVSVTSSMTISTVNIAAGNMKFTPKVNGTGQIYARFTFQVQDSGGTGNGGFDTDSAPKTLTISVK